MTQRWWCTFLLVSLFIVAKGESTAFRDKLAGLPFVKKIDVLEANENFSEKYLVWVEQPIDHKKPDEGSFLQRVIVSHLEEHRPVVMITEGYGANYALSKSYTNELSKLLKANQICIEHRYFNESTPENADWKFLTTRNAAYDHHRINQMFKQIYKEKWIATGISKGGQTAILYKYYFPDDVDISVPYVAPVNFGVEDGRHELFLNAVSSKSDREKVQAFQIEVLKRRDKLQSYFDKYCEEEKLSFQIPLDEVYDYSVLEYAFAFWQWGDDVNRIPSPAANDSTILRHFLEVSNPDYFSVEGTKPILSFFIQAAHELGYYGYDTAPFKEWLKIKSSKDYLSMVFLPDNVSLRWKRTMRKCDRKVQRDGNNMLYIYGEYDPWSATGIELNGKTNALKLVKPGGSHRTRIYNLPEDMKQQAMDSLNVWLAR